VPILKNARHEVFAQNLASGMSQEDAYVNAGYEPAQAKTAASRLLSTNVNIADRVRELKERGAARVEVTLSYLLEQGMDLLKKASAAEDFSAASATYERLAKVSGHWVDKSKTDTTVNLRFRPLGG